MEVTRGVPVYGPVEQADFVRGVENHRRALRQYIARRVPPNLVDDVLQDTLLGAYGSDRRRDPARPWLPWLYAIARRMCAQAQHREMRHRLGVGDLPVPPPAAEPEEILETARLARALDAAWCALNPRHRRLLYLRCVEGLRYEQLVAEEADTRDVLKAAVHRARSRLRENYADALQRIAVGIPALCLKGRRWAQRLLRDRFTSVEGLAAGFVSVGIVTAAMVTVGTASTAASSAESVPASITVTAPGRPSANMPRLIDHEGRRRPTTSASGGDTPSRPPTLQAPAELPVRSKTAVDLGADRTSAEMTISVDDPTSQYDGGLHVTFECAENSVISRTVCAVARSTPNAGG